MDFNIIATADLRQHEFAALAGVSRVTTNLWVSGKMAPHRFIRADIENLIAEIKIALENKHLPIDRGVPKHLRMRTIREAVSSLAQPQ